jgi:drug/metabolite transporter (DMT)-like permease
LKAPGTLANIGAIQPQVQRVGRVRPGLAKDCAVSKLLDFLHIASVFAALLTTVLFSISVVCGHRSAMLIGGTEANFWRLTLATLFLGAWAFGCGTGLSGEAFPLFLLSGFLGIGVGDVALFQALPRLGSRLSLLLIQCLTAPLGALIEWFWLGTGLTARQVFCGFLILAGVAVALSPSEHLQRPRRQVVAGTLFSILAALGGAWGAVLSRRAYDVVHTSGRPVDGASAAFQRIVGGLFIGGICLLIAKRGMFRAQSRPSSQVLAEAPVRKWRKVWPWVLVNSLAGQTLGVSCMQWALETTPTGLVLAIIAMTPVVVIPLALVFEKERPGARSLLGGAVATAGVVALMVWR